MVEAKTLAHLQAEKMAEKRFTDLMASVGLTSDRMALELMYWLPSNFRDAYERLYLEALTGHDGGTNNRGQTAGRDSALGKATNTGTGKQLKGRKYKKYWTVQDEEVLELKEKIDKRLRELARDVEFLLSEIEAKRMKTGTKTGTKAGTAIGAGAGRRSTRKPEWRTPEEKAKEDKKGLQG